MHVLSGTRQQNRSVLWTAVALSVVSVIPIHWWPLSVSSVSAQVNAHTTDVTTAADAATEHAMSVAFPSTFHPSTSPKDLPAPNGPMPLYVRDGENLYRLVHRISQWQAATRTWTFVSPDLTQESLPQSMGYGVDGITAGAENKGVWYVGTLIGNVMVKFPNTPWAYRDNDLPLRTVTAATIQPDDMSGRSAVIGFGGYRSSTPDNPGHVFVTMNGGVDWMDESGNLPDAPIEQLKYVSQDDHLALLAKTAGHWYQLNSPQHWAEVQGTAESP